MRTGDADRPAGAAGPEAQPGATVAAAGARAPERFRDAAARLAESVRQEHDRDSLSCSLALLWRQHLEVRLGQLVTAGRLVLEEGRAAAAAPNALDALWPEARDLLHRLWPALGPRLLDADAVVSELLRAWAGPGGPRLGPSADLAAFHDALTRVAVLLDEVAERLGRKVEWKDDALSWID